MTKLTESAIYSPTIFRLETTTPVAGGAVILDGNDDPVQGYANAQAQLLANRTKYLKGVTDTLGTAAVANLTTSTTDTTAGRVLKTGDAGVLGPTPGYSDGNALPNGQGFYCWFMEGVSSINLPLPVVENWQGLESGGANINRGFVIAAGLATGNLVWRTRSAGINSPWRTAWSNLSENAITVDTGSLGYGIGSGGTVTQDTNKSTAVTLNKPNGQITMSNALLVAGASVQFQLINNKVATSDTVVTSMFGGGALTAYSLRSYVGTAGSIFFVLKNESAVDRSEAYQFNFTIIKGATA